MAPPVLKQPPLAPPTTTAKRIAFGKIATGAGHRVLLYGPGGIGKTTLASTTPGPVAFFDLDESLPRLQSQLAEIPHVLDVRTWKDLRLALQMDGWDSIKTIVIDSITKCEEMCIAHTLATVPNEKGVTVSKLEDYGYGKGYQFVFETFLPLLGDLDRHCRQGRNVILVAHDCTTNVPNPAGLDWIRWEPRLQSPTSGKASIRLRVKEWSDHTLFLGYDIAVDKEGKATGGQSRTLYPIELPSAMAKSRTAQNPIVVTQDTNVWAEIIK